VIHTGILKATSVVTLAPVLAAIAAASRHVTATEIRSSIQWTSSLAAWKAIGMATAIVVLEVTWVGVCEGTLKAAWIETCVAAAAAKTGTVG